MDTAIISLVCIALLVFGGMTMARGFFTSVDNTAGNLEEISTRGEQVMRTELKPYSTSMNAGRDTLLIDLENTGQTRLADFDKWDIIVQYYDGDGNYYTRWLPYAASPGDNEWEVAQILMNGEEEIFEPDVLNPGEMIRISANLEPPAGEGTTNLVVVSTPNGVRATTSFSP